MKQRLLVTLAVVLAVGAGALAYVHQLFVSVAPGAKMVAADECTQPQAPKENPNKTLFISCGGFFE